MPHPRRPRFLALFAVLALGTIALTLWVNRPAPPRYTVTDLGVLPGYVSVTAVAVNSRGDVACSANNTGSGTGRACVYQGGRLVTLGVPPGFTDDMASSMNSWGEVVGTACASGHSNTSHAFLYSRGKMQDLGTLPGLPETYVTGLNNRGQVVGGALAARGKTGKRPPDHAFLFSSGHMMPLPPPPGCTEVVAIGINDAGQVVVNPYGGRLSQPFLYDAQTGRWTTLAPPAGAQQGGASALNGQGQAAGWAGPFGGTFNTEPSTHAVLWSGGAATDLGTLPGATDSGAFALNGRGEVVGFAEYEPSAAGEAIGMRLRESNPLRRLFRTNSTRRAFMWRAGRMADLNDLIPRASGWTLAEAHGINDRGQIVGDGEHDGQQRAFLLTPLR